MNRIQAAITGLRTSLAEAADANPVFLSTGEKAHALVELGRIEARVHELRLRVLAVSGDLADDIGARDPAAWLVAQAHTDATPATRDLALARALETWEHVRTGLAAGRFSAEHARIIVRALEALPDHLPRTVIASAERDLCDYATQMRPKDLRVCGKRILHTTAPEIADLEDEKAIRRLEAEIEDKVTLSITPQGDGTSRVFALVPEAVGERLRVLLESFTQPRIAALDADGTPRPRCRVMADALGDLLECVDPDGLHDHGSDTTTVIVTMTLEQLRGDLANAGIAQVAGVDVGAGQARRLACTSRLIPMILGGRSEPLDLGRARRLHTPAQRKAMRIRDQHCRAEGCTVPRPGATHTTTTPGTSAAPPTSTPDHSCAATTTASSTTRPTRPPDSPAATTGSPATGHPRSSAGPKHRARRDNRLVTFSIAFVTGATPDKWARVWRERSNERLELIPVAESEQLDGVRAGEISMALVRLPIDREGLHCIPLYEEQQVVVVGKEHYLSLADEITLAELADEQLVLPHPSGWTPAAKQLDWPAMSEKDAIEVAASGGGIVILPASIARLHHRKDVVAHPVADLDPTKVGLAWRVDDEDERVQTFIGIVRGRTARSSRS